jgi:methionyl-tRNA formyltransferase|tara:strand:+ start:67 stop:660 length:594 start_codon:yes stop_codon:yes gene_type:complete
MSKKVFITDNKDIGLQCKQWAEKNLLDGYIITDDMNDCDIFISVLYDKILDRDFLESRKCYNFHPAILPNYAGVGTMTWSILNEERHHGITLHMINEGIDTGDIIDIVKFDIDEQETSYSLHKKTMNKIFDFFREKFYTILKKDYDTYKQDFSKRKVYTYKKLDELLDLTKYMRATYFPNKSKPYYRKGTKKIEVEY